MEDKLYYLEPCPFCGGVDLEYGHCKDTLGMAFVRCVACSAEIRQYNTTAKVVNAWNKRAKEMPSASDGDDDKNI